MDHVLIDAYGCNTSRLDNLMDVYSVMNEILNKMQVKAVMPIQLIPYYYCQNEEDVGISAFVIIKGGHLTIHTFPRLGCYFLDLLYDGFVQSVVLENVLKAEFPSNSFFSKKIAREDFENDDLKNYDSADFGPHYMISAVMDTEPTIDRFYHILDKIPYRVGMHPISRPCVVTDKVNDPEYLSAIVVIAESHIAMHYNYKTKQLLMDIFSCKSIEEKKYSEMIHSLLGDNYRDDLIHRGRKHAVRQQSQLVTHDNYKGWQEYIVEEE